MQTDAGVKSDGILTVNLMAALFDMSAFVLISGRGDQKVRQIQQALNKRYSEELGIMPCDGIYQRATNTALIYHLQRTIGMSANVANGNYGPGTISQTPSVRKGTQGEIVRIIRYGLYVNGFDTGSFSDVFDDSVANEIINFRKFMQLTPFVETADLTVIKGLLTSNGNTSRDSNAIDTATILSASNAQKFKAAGYDIVGRYLTGTVGVGSSKRNKSLSVKEIEDITKAGLRIFPIYEDGGYEIDYFTAKQGLEDAHLAYAAANQLGFPAGTTIYFAVDVDALGEEIDNQIGTKIEKDGECCTLDSWYLDKDLKNRFDEDTQINNNLTLFGRWECRETETVNVPDTPPAIAAKINAGFIKMYGK